MRRVFVYSLMGTVMQQATHSPTVAKAKSIISWKFWKTLFVMVKTI